MVFRLPKRKIELPKELQLRNTIMCAVGLSGLSDKETKNCLREVINQIDKKAKGEYY